MKGEPGAWNRAGKGIPTRLALAWRKKGPIRNHPADLADNHCVDNNGACNEAIQCHARKGYFRMK